MLRRHYLISVVISSLPGKTIINHRTKDSRLVQFNESGHGLNIEEKDKTNEELMKFIG
jgi:hypothetical protein